MRVAFAGTPAFAASALAAIVDAGHDVVLVLAQPDRPSGRGLNVVAGPVAHCAKARGLPLVQPAGLKRGGRHDDDARAAHARLAQAQADVMVVAAYGLLLPPSVLAIPASGCLNIHASLLPRWRGAAPVQRAIEAGDATTGITIMRMDAGLDTGDMLATRAMAIAPDDTGGTLTAKLATLGAEAIVHALADLAAGRLRAVPQPAPGDPAITYAAKLTKAEAMLDFAQPARVLADRVRAFDPWPGCTASLADGGTLRVWSAHARSLATTAPDGTIVAVGDDGIAVATGDGALVMTVVQKAGGPRRAAAVFKAELATGARFVSG